MASLVGPEMEATSVETTGRQVLTRIGLTERWLDRARRQCQDGDVSRGLLTLVLADAEMRHALQEAGAPGLRTSRRRPAAALAAVASAVAVISAAGLVFGGRLWVDPAPAVITGAPPVVTLAPRVGALLALVQAAAPVQFAAPAVTSTVRRPLATRPAPQSRAHVITPAPEDAGDAVTVRAVRVPVPQAALPVSPPALRAVAAADPTLSDSELIDLVITAERTLRSAPPRP